MRFHIHNLMALCLFSVLVLIISNSGYADESDIEKQQALQKEIEHSLVAPCCWNMTVDQHDSQASRQVRAKIAELIKQGKTKDEILAYFVAQPQYGERILATPSQKTLLGKLAYWLIPIAIVLGIFVVGKTINRFSQGTPQKQNKPTPVTEQKSEPSIWDKKVENELKNYD
ncbi:MAG: cytochrome c-type biogenesis protein CcmH [bacterium]